MCNIGVEANVIGLKTLTALLSIGMIENKYKVKDVNLDQCSTVVLIDKIQNKYKHKIMTE